MKPYLSDLTAPGYTPGRLLDKASRALGARSDRELAARLGLNPGTISRIRHRQDAVSSRLMCDIMDRTGWAIQYVRELAGIPFIPQAVMKEAA